MFANILRFIKGVDIILFLSVIILAAFGCAALYSIGLGKDPQSFAFIQRQALVFGAFLVASFLVAAFNYRWFQSYSILLYVGSLAVLFAVLFFGDTIRGTKGWFFVGSFGFQPAELAKIALIFILARYFSRYTRQIGQLRHVFFTGLLAVLPTTLILLQPDFGSAAVLFCIWAGMIIMSGVPKKYLIGLLLIVSTLLVSAWFFAFKDYQKQRILTFLAPASDPKGSGYNVNQAMIAIGSGEIFGRGLGLGSQSHLKFLPETQTDFIFSVLAEETGLIGLFIVFIMWVIFFYRLCQTMRRARDDFALFSVLGIAIMFIVHVVFNVGGNLGVVPLTGLVLPFMSYGGSALMMSLLAVGVVQSVKVHS